MHREGGPFACRPGAGDAGVIQRHREAQGSPADSDRTPFAESDFQFGYLAYARERLRIYYRHECHRDDVGGAAIRGVR